MKKNKTHNSKNKILLAILLSGIITTFANASIPSKNKEIFNFDMLENIFLIDENTVLSPYQIQGNFETSWNPNNFWNANDNGGIAIGPFQIHSRYMLAPFFGYLKENGTVYFDMLNAKGGIDAVKKNSPEMRKFFCELCKNSEFIKLQETFIDKANFQPRLSILKSKYGLDISKRSPSIEGIFRVMSGNIGWRTNDVVAEMIKCLEVKELDINSITDKEFISVLEQSIYKVINRDIQPKFKEYLLNAYKKVINNDVIPNMEKEKNFSSMNERIRKSTQFFRINKNYITSTLKNRIPDFDNKYVKNDNDFDRNTYYPFLPKNTIQPITNDKFYIIKERKVVKNTGKKQSLLRKAELLLQEEKISNKENIITQTNDNVLTVDAVIAKATRNRRKRKSEFDFSDILSEAASYTI